MNDESAEWMMDDCLLACLLASLLACLNIEGCLANSYQVLAKT